MPHKDPEKRRQYLRKYRQEIKDGLRKVGTFESLRTGHNVHCAFCKREFYRSAAHMRHKNQYCSRQCMAKAFEGRFVGEKSPRWMGRETRQCDNCGKPITRPLWAFNQGREHIFCDSKCFGEWKSKNWTGEDNPCWRGGHFPYYGPNWKRQSREARKRDDHRCQVCELPEYESRRALDVHHIVPFRFFDSDGFRKANALSNLITLCTVCHGYAEQISKEGKVSSWQELFPLITMRF